MSKRTSKAVIRYVKGGGPDEIGEYFEKVFDSHLDQFVTRYKPRWRAKVRVWNKQHKSESGVK